MYPPNVSGGGWAPLPAYHVLVAGMCTCWVQVWCKWANVVKSSWVFGGAFMYCLDCKSIYWVKMVGLVVLHVCSTLIRLTSASLMSKTANICLTLSLTLFCPKILKSGLPLFYTHSSIIKKCLGWCSIQCTDVEPLTVCCVCVQHCFCHYTHEILRPQTLMTVQHNYTQGSILEEKWTAFGDPQLLCVLERCSTK